MSGPKAGGGGAARLPVHLVAGFLGAGKTTLLLSLVPRLAGRSAVIVNDFGEARFDGLRLGSAGLAVRDIPGGCVCCTAPEGLVETVAALLEQEAPDRLFIEATGLARPADVIDTLARSPLAPRLRLAPVIVVVDPARPEAQPPFDEQLAAGDVIVLNRCDLATPARRAAMRARLAARLPAPLAVVEAVRGEVDPAILDLDFPADRPARLLPRSGGASTAGWAVRSRAWPADRVFPMAEVEALAADPALERVRGLVRTDLGWVRVERAGGRVDVAPTPYRGGSVLELIAPGDGAALDARLEALDRARPAAVDGGVLEVVPLEGAPVRLDREGLAALPGQVPDVGERFPGRAGVGVALGEVLRAGGLRPGEAFVLVASDGMTAGPTPFEAAERAVLVHTLGDGPLPAGKGGPFRLLVPAEQRACASVKGLVRIVARRGAP